MLILVIQRSFDDSSTLITFFYGLVYLIIQGIDIFNERIINLFINTFAK